MLFHRCTKRNPKNEWPLDVIETCFVCKEDHSYEKFPYFPCFKVVYQGSKESMEKLYFVNKSMP